MRQPSMRTRAIASASRGAARRMTMPGELSKNAADGGDDMIDGEAEMLEQHGRGGRFPETIDADDSAGGIVDGADVFAPVVGDAGLDRDARQPARQYRLAISGVLAIEDAAARHRYDAHRQAGLGQRLLRADGERDLGAGGDDRRPRALGVHEDIGAAADRLDLVGAAWIERDTLPRQQQAAWAAPVLERRRPCQRGLDGVAGPPDIELRDQPQRRGMLDRLVRRSVLAEPDR